MPLSLKKYHEIHNNVCICYFGSNEEVIQKIIDNDKLIKKYFPELEITYALRRVNDKINSVTKEELKKGLFAYVWDITRNFGIFFDQLNSHFNVKNINTLEDKDQKEHKISKEN